MKVLHFSCKTNHFYSRPQSKFKWGSIQFSPNVQNGSPRHTVHFTKIYNFMVIFTCSGMLAHKKQLQCGTYQYKFNNIMQENKSCITLNCHFYRDLVCGQARLYPCVILILLINTWNQVTSILTFIILKIPNIQTSTSEYFMPLWGGYCGVLGLSMLLTEIDYPIHLYQYSVIWLYRDYFKIDMGKSAVGVPRPVAVCRGTSNLTLEFTQSFFHDSTLK